MRTSDAIDLVSAALAAAQGEFGHIPRSRTVKVKTKAGYTYEFAYAPLDVILAAVRPALAKNSIAVIQDIADKAVVTRLIHASGQFIESSPTPLHVGESGAQAFGSAVTYARRYSLSALLNVVAEDDDDGNAADGNAAREVRQRPSAEESAPETTAEDSQRARQPTVDDKAKGVKALRNRWFEARAEKDTNDAWARVCQQITDDASWDPLMLDQWNRERFKTVKAQVEAVEANPPTIDDKMREQMRQQVKGVKLAMERVQPALSDWEEFANWAGIVLDWPNMHTADLGKISAEQLKALGDAARDAVNEMEASPA